MNETEDANDRRMESCPLVSSECQPDKPNPSQSQLETTNFTVDEGKVASYLLTIIPTEAIY